MDFVGLLVFGIVVLAGVFAITRLMSHAGRNDGSTHGGGVEQAHWH
jgi:hypothetical protein